MLHKDRISQAIHGSEEWKQLRIGRFTASKAARICQPRGISMSYVREKVGESITRLSAEKEIDTDDTRWGIVYEPEAIRKFAERMGIKMLVTQRAVHESGSMFVSTPDAIWVKNETADKLAYEVSCAEIKCFPTFTHHVEMLECHSSADLRAADPDVYWQVLSHMDKDACDCLTGYAVFYHPDFPLDKGGLHYIEFKKMLKDINGTYPIVEDLKFLRQRKEQAMYEFNRIKSLILDRQKKVA